MVVEDKVEKKLKAARRGHPLLRGAEIKKRRSSGEYTHGLGAAQMAALTAICGALIPSIPGAAGSAGRAAPCESLEAFYLATGSDYLVPDEVAQLMVERCVWEAVVLVKIVLWLLSTRIGTLLFCGRLCLSLNFPFVACFAEMPAPAREAALQQWSRASWLPPLRVLFAVAKILSNFVFYSMLNDNSENPWWDAIGYKLPEQEDEAEQQETGRPLDSGVIETTSLADDGVLLRELAAKGLTARLDGSEIVVECDAVIVGSGCGGAVAAAVLSKAGYRVVVVEKGQYFSRRDFTSIEGPSLEHMMEKGTIFCTANLTTLLFAGATVGGGSAVNWSACIRTPDDVLDEWAHEQRLPMFGGDEYRRAMDTVHARLAVTENCADEGLQNKVLRKGCEQLGLNVDSVPRNSSDHHYCGFCCFGCPSGEKRGADTTWLVDAVAHNAVIITGCKADQFVLDKKTNQCRGLIATPLSDAITKKLRIEAKVSVAACGALMTPPLLRASGLKNRHIGKNLRLHPVAMAWGYFPDGGRAAYDGGIITSVHKVSNTRAVIETPALGPAAFSAMVPWTSGSDMKARMARYARTVHIFTLVRDRGSGVVSGEGRVRYSLDHRDRADMEKGLHTALRVLVAAGATEVGTHRSDGPRAHSASADIADRLNGMADVAGGALRVGSEIWGVLSSAHQMGSCRMAASDRDGAVDGNGESWEAKGLFVCDGSVLPTAVGVNPMITIQSTAYCIAGGIVQYLDSLKGSKE